MKRTKKLREERGASELGGGKLPPGAEGDGRP